MPHPSSRDLLARALEARAHAYAPYSRFPVGAALLAVDGRVFPGCNVENAAYGLACCAERVALFRAVSEGVRDFTAMAVVGPGEEPCPPCGSCRQALLEFAPELRVITRGKGASEPLVQPLSELLPSAFGPGVLGREGE